MLSQLTGASSLLNRQLSLQKGAGMSADEENTFSSLLEKAIESANELQLEADQAAQALALGEIEDLHAVTIASAKADLALQLTIQIRNRVVDAYQEIMRMQV